MAPASAPPAEPKVHERYKTIYSDEFKDRTPDQRKALRRQYDAIEISEEYVRPHWDKALRFEKLYYNVLPEELDCSFSKVMLPIASNIVQNELPRSAATLFSTENFFMLQANDRKWEYAKEAATNWLNYTAREKNRIFPRIMPTLQSVSIRGTGYRAVTHMMKSKLEMERKPRGSFAGIPIGFEDQQKVVKELGIVSQNVDFYSGLPAPNGGMMNTMDNMGEEAVEWFHWIQYMSENKLKQLKKSKFSNSKEIDMMMATPGAKDTTGQIDTEFRQAALDATLGTDAPEWIMRVRDQNKAVSSRWRCVWTWFRDQWMLVGEGRYLLYLGPPLLDWFPMAKYVDTPNLMQFFGRGLIEVCEDIILAYLLTHNFRMDYLTTTLHPTKFIRDDVVKLNAGELNDFDPTPFGVFKFSKRIKKIQEAVWYDRFPEISPQAFIEETSFKQMLQEGTGQPNYMKGMGGAGALANETATGIVSLIEEGTARSSLRSLMIEYIGLHDELMLMLKWGKKYVHQDEEVRITDKKGVWPWRMVPHSRIDDGYGIELRGTRGLVHKNEMVKRMMSFLPMVLNNPNVGNQIELIQQAADKMNIGLDMEKILGNSPDAGGTLGPVPNQVGAGGTPTVQNEAQAVGGALPQAAAQTEARFAL
jgi:hypothetical protein